MNRLVLFIAASSLGLLAGVSFAPLRIPGAFFVALLGLFAILRSPYIRLSAIKSALSMAGFSLGLFGVSIWWMNAVSPAAWVAIVLAQVLIVTAGGAFVPFLMLHRWWPLWLASWWTLLEMFRGRLPFTGFPWLRASHTLLDTGFEGIVRWVGLTAGSWLVALVAALLICAIEQRKFVPAGLALALSMVALVAPTGIVGESGTLRVAAVQGNTPGPFGTWRYGEIFQLHLDETARITEAVDLVVWPENASDRDLLADVDAAEQVSRLAEYIDAPILAGAIVDAPDPNYALNISVPVTPSDGVASDFYTKRFIVPYGEYVPFRQLLGRFVPRFDREIPQDMIAGTKPGAIPISGTVAGAAICWDVAHDRAIYESVHSGAAFIAVQTSNATFADFGHGVQPQQQWDISRLRAIETGRWVVVASTNGVSGFINPDGEVVAQLPVRTSATAIETISLAHGQTMATRWSLAVSWLIGVLALSGVLIGALRKRKVRS